MAGVEFRGMPCRTVGNSGLYVSAIGVGMWKWGDPSYDGSRIGDHEGFQVLDRALELGVFHWDNACSYNAGSGNSERLLGRYFAARPKAVREQVVLATKIHNPVRDEHQMQADFTPNQSGGSRKYIRYAVDKCLERTQTDYIDLMYLHQPVVDDDGNYRTPLDETWAAFDDLVTQGKLNYIGISNHNVKQLQHTVEVLERVGANLSRRIVAVQNRYNLLERVKVTSESDGDEQGFLGAAEKAGVGVVPFYPLASGLLTGRYRKDTLDSADGRIIDDNQQDEFLTEANLTAVEGLAEVADGKGVSLPQLAIAWLLANPNVPSVIAGVSKVEQLEDNVKAAQVELSEEELKRIDEILEGAKLL